MKKNVLFPALSAILSGFVLALIGYFLFQKGPVDLSKQVAIYHFHTDMNALAVQDIIKSFAPTANSEELKRDEELIKKYGEKNYDLSAYRVENKGDTEIQNLRVSLGSHRRAYLTNRNSFQIFDEEKSEFNAKILPRTSVILLVISEYTTPTPQEKFLVDSKDVPIYSFTEDIDYGLDNDIFIFLKKYGIAVAIFCFIGVSAVFIILFAIFFEIFTSNNRNIQVKSVENGTLAKNLTIINIIKSDDPDRFKAVVSKSEEIYLKWKIEERGGIGEEGKN